MTEQVTGKPSEFDIKKIEAMNQKTIRNQFFTPDKVYIELGLFKDFSIGAVYADQLVFKNDPVKFGEIQTTLASFVKEYQTRRYDTVNDFFPQIGYNDDLIDGLLANPEIHNEIFLVSPNTSFMQTLIRHTLRNQNNSRPADKYTRQKLDNERSVIQAIPVSYRINTYPLTLNSKLLQPLAEELGEAFGVDVIFMCKDPALFDETDWNDWLKDIECFYLDSLGRFTQSPFTLSKQGEMEFVGCYFFIRKRFERHVMKVIQQHNDFDEQIQLLTSHLGILCDLEWLQNNDVRLTDEPDNVPMMDEDQGEPESHGASDNGN